MRFIPSGHFSILEIDPVAPLDVDYLPVEHYFGRGSNFLISSRSE